MNAVSVVFFFYYFFYILGHTLSLLFSIIYSNWGKRATCLDAGIWQSIHLESYDEVPQNVVDLVFVQQISLLIYICFFAVFLLIVWYIRNYVKIKYTPTLMAILHVVIIIPWMWVNHMVLAWNCMRSFGNLPFEFKIGEGHLIVRGISQQKPDKCGVVADKDGVADVSGVEGTDVTTFTPIEQFDIIPLIPMNIVDLYFSFTNPSLFMLLTLSLVLLLLYFVTKNGGGKPKAP